MTSLLNETSGFLAGIAILIATAAVVPFLLRVLVPQIGEPLWRDYWRLVRWVLLAPMRLLAHLIRLSIWRR
jgi:hypothetical protein